MKNNIFIHKFADLGDFKMHYVEKGEERAIPLLFIHGLGAYCYTWRKNWDILGEYFRVLAVDLKGFGFSDKPRGKGYSIQSHVNWVLRFLDKVNVTTTHIVGSSMGGEIGLRLARKYPERVHKLVLIAPSCYKINLPPYAYLLRHLPYSLFIRKWIRKKFMCAEKLLNSVQGAYYQKENITEQEIKNYLLPVFLDGFDYAYIQMLREFDFGKEQKYYKEIKHPTLIISGEKDKVIPNQHLHRLHRELHDSTFIKLPKTGHFPHEEKADEVNDLILNFLQQ